MQECYLHQVFRVSLGKYEYYNAVLSLRQTRTEETGYTRVSTLESTCQASNTPFQG